MAKRNRQSRSAKPKMAYAEGGAVDAQMEAMLSEGVDPVSGNDVPVGAMPKEVRDDIDAKLSEGEYVVPADVVRYFGVNFFEDLRKEAKQGWQDMEANGRVGGEPVGMEMADDELPFDLAELSIVEAEDDDQPEMSEGGWMKGYAEGGVVSDDPMAMVNEILSGMDPAVVKAATMNPPDFLKPYYSALADIEKTEFKTYKNDAGMTLTVRMVDGKPIGYVPPGYEEVSPAQASSVVKTEEREGGGPEGGKDGTTDTTTGEESSTDASISVSNAVSAVGVSAVMGMLGVVGTISLGIEAVNNLTNSNIPNPVMDKVQDLFSSITGKTSKSTETTSSTTGKTSTPSAPPGRPGGSQGQEAFGGTPTGPTAAQSAQAATEATIGLDAFGGQGPSVDTAFGGNPTGPTAAQSAQAANEATIGLDAFGGTGASVGGTSESSSSGPSVGNEPGMDATGQTDTDGLGVG